MSNVSSVSNYSSVYYPQHIQNKKRGKATYIMSQPTNKDITPKTSKKKWLGWALGIGALLIGAGAIIATKGKALRKQKLLAEIPADLQARFKNLNNLKGKEFVDKAYSEMVEYMGLKGIAPSKIVQQGSDGVMSVQGGYNPISNTISYTSGFFTKLDKAKQLNMLSHELKHCEQYTNMLRTEGITVEKYVESAVDSLIKNSIKSPLNNPVFNMRYHQAKTSGKEKEFLKVVKENWTKELSEEVNKNYSDVLKMPKFKSDSPEGIKAFKDLKANSEYEYLDIFGLGSKAYKNNPIEVEAYAYGEKIENLFRKFNKAYNLSV